jgi:hypothetical protein
VTECWLDRLPERWLLSRMRDQPIPEVTARATFTGQPSSSPLITFQGPRCARRSHRPTLISAKLVAEPSGLHEGASQSHQCFVTAKRARRGELNLSRVDADSQDALRRPASGEAEGQDHGAVRPVAGRDGRDEPGVLSRGRGRAGAHGHDHAGESPGGLAGVAGRMVDILSKKLSPTWAKLRPTWAKLGPTPIFAGFGPRIGHF